jgi:hypothetical protein
MKQDTFTPLHTAEKLIRVAAVCSGVNVSCFIMNGVLGTAEKLIRVAVAGSSPMSVIVAGMTA